MLETILGEGGGRSNTKSPEKKFTLGEEEMARYTILATIENYVRMLQEKGEKEAYIRDVVGEIDHSLKILNIKD
jgi:hypothetical protein